MTVSIEDQIRYARTVEYVPGGIRLNGGPVIPGDFRPQWQMVAGEWVLVCRITNAPASTSPTPRTPSPPP